MNLSTKLCIAISLPLTIALAGCSKPKPVADAAVYDHIQQFADESATHLIDSCPDAITRQTELLRAAARVAVLEASGDSLLAEVFRLKLEDSVRRADAAMADSIFVSSSRAFSRR